MDRLIEYLRSHQWARRGLSVLSVALLAGAVGLLGYPLYTNFYQGRVQDRLTDEIASPELQEKYRQRQIGVGESLTRIQIPKLKVDTIVVEGTTASALRAGAGHYPDTPLPCEDGNVAIAGHRTTYGKPFANVDQLQEGDIIILTTPVGTCTYAVSKQPFVVEPRNLDVIANTPTTRELTLTTCHPKHSAAKRLIVKAIYVSGEPGTA